MWWSALLYVSMRGFFLPQQLFSQSQWTRHTLTYALTRSIQHLSVCVCVFGANIKNSLTHPTMPQNVLWSNSSVCCGTSWGHERSSHRAHLLCLPDLPLCYGSICTKPLACDMTGQNDSFNAPSAETQRCEEDLLADKAEISSFCGLTTLWNIIFC